MQDFAVTIQWKSHYFISYYKKERQMDFVLTSSTSSSVTCLNRKANCHLWSPPPNSPRGGSITAGLFKLQALLIHWLLDMVWRGNGQMVEKPRDCPGLSGYCARRWGDRPDVSKQPVSWAHWFGGFFWTVLLAFNFSVPTCPSRLGSLWLPCFFVVPSWSPSSTLAPSRPKFPPCNHPFTYCVPPEVILHVPVCALPV